MAVRLAYTALAAAVVCSLIGVASPGPRRINIRWADAATLAQRVTAEQALGLRNPRQVDAVTWSYEVPDVASIERVLQHPLADDTHHIDRDRRTFAPELPASRARIRELYGAAPLALLAAHWRWVSAALLLIALALAWPAVRLASRASPDRIWLAIVLALSLVARLVLVLAGGQHYWPDEGRYSEAQSMVEDLRAGDVGRAWSRAVTSGHPLFKTIGMLPAAFEAIHGPHPGIPAAFFALFSVLNIWLLARIARRLDATPTEAVWVAAMAAASVSLLFYSRHLFPYDLALTFGLLALYTGVNSRAGVRASLQCGIWAGCAFLTYFGAWTFGAAACAIHVCDASSRRSAIRRGALAAAGLAIPIAAAIVGSALAGEDFFSRLREFAAQVTQGRLEEGWQLPIAYLWHAERWLLVLWLAAVACCVVFWRSWWTVRTARAGMVGLVCLYGALAVLSTGLHVFVVYGRLSRQLVPFFCLVAAAVVTRVVGSSPARWRRPVLTAVAAAVLVQAGVNAWPLFRQRFPRQFVVDGEQLAGRRGAAHATAIYAGHLYPPAKVDPPVGYVEVLSAPHPLQFIPYQYEGFSPAERQLLRSIDIRMRVLIPESGGQPPATGP